MHSVADELAFDALPPETRALVERVIASRTEDAGDRAWHDGYRFGYQTAQADERAKALAATTPPPKDVRIS